MSLSFLLFAHCNYKAHAASRWRRHLPELRIGAPAKSPIRIEFVPKGAEGACFVMRSAAFVREEAIEDNGRVRDEEGSCPK
jgi:hypothetical protein